MGLTLYGSLQPEFPKLLMVPGMEWTTYSGHANAIGAVDWVDQKIGVRGVAAESAIQAFHDQGALFSIDHPTVPGGNFCIGCPWEIEVDVTTIDAVEVQGGVWEAIDFWEGLCVDGSHASAVGGSDDHRGGQGSGALYSPMGTPTTMVYAEELSVSAIIDGIRSGRTVVKVNGLGGPMLETELSGERMGNTVFAETSTLSVEVTGAVGDTLLVIKNGESLENVPITSDPFTHETEVIAPAVGEDRYRHQIVFGNEPKTIGSYVWLRTPAETPDGGVPDGGVDAGTDGGTDPGSSSSGCRVSSAPDYDTVFVSIALALGVWVFRRRST